jgi:phage terminase large subunit-like protein
LLASLPPEQLAAFLKRTSDRELEAIEHDWGWWGRPNQQAPKGDWRTWLLLAGRGFGKTRSGAECIREQVIHHGRRRIALVAPTAADARDVMVGRRERHAGDRATAAAAALPADQAPADLAERGHCDNLQRRRAGAPARAATRRSMV